MTFLCEKNSKAAKNRCGHGSRRFESRVGLSLILKNHELIHFVVVLSFNQIKQAGVGFKAQRAEGLLYILL